MKTVQELEDELQKAQRARRGSTPPGLPVHRGATPPGIPAHRGSPQGNDLTAFNKLISLMQAGAARPVESPKLQVNIQVKV